MLPLRSLAALVPVTIAASLLSTAPVHAQALSITDEAGDTSGRGLDITAATVRNRDHRIVAEVTFDRARAGDLVVSVDRRGGRGLRMVSRYRPDGTTRNLVLSGAFTDRGPGRRVACSGFRVRWDTEAETATLRLPARCLNRGNYGAVRFAVLTEPARGGGDVDYAPDTESGSSAWIPRG